MAAKTEKLTNDGRGHILREGTRKGGVLNCAKVNAMRNKDSLLHRETTAPKWRHKTSRIGK